MSDDRIDNGVYSAAMSENGSTTLSSGDAGKDKAAEELEDAHEHADPSKGDKGADGDGRVKTDDVPQSSGVADEQAAMFERAI